MAHASTRSGRGSKGTAPWPARARVPLIGVGIVVSVTMAVAAPAAHGKGSTTTGAHKPGKTTTTLPSSVPTGLTLSGSGTFNWSMDVEGFCTGPVSSTGTWTLNPTTVPLAAVPQGIEVAAVATTQGTTDLSNPCVQLGLAFAGSSIGSSVSGQANLTFDVSVGPPATVTVVPPLEEQNLLANASHQCSQMIATGMFTSCSFDTGVAWTAPDGFTSSIDGSTLNCPTTTTTTTTTTSSTTTVNHSTSTTKPHKKNGKSTTTTKVVAKSTTTTKKGAPQPCTLKASNTYTATGTMTSYPCFHLSGITQISCSGSGTADLSIKVSTAKFQPDIKVSPTRLNFQNAKVPGKGRAQQQILDVTVSNQPDATAPLALTSTSIGGPTSKAFTIVSDGCSGHTVAKGNACTIAVGFAPTKRGKVIATLSIASNAPTPLSTIKVPLAGTGT